MKLPADRGTILAKFRDGPALLDAVLAGLSEKELDTLPQNGGWTIRQIVHHIVDGDDLWKTCIKMALGNGQAEFNLDWYSALPQDEWAHHWFYSKRSIDISLDLLKTSRKHILQLLEHVPDGWRRSVAFRNPDGTTENVPVGFIVEMQSNHIAHHVDRIKAILNETGRASQ